MKYQKNTITTFFLVVPRDYKGRRDYKRINSARKKAALLSIQYPSIMIRIEEKATNCVVECSGHFEVYENGKRTREHKDYLTEAGKKAYGYI